MLGVVISVYQNQWTMLFTDWLLNLRTVLYKVWSAIYSSIVEHIYRDAEIYLPTLRWKIDVVYTKPLK